jgi:metal-responsive CopG/Arc/MetJ family transcriptional regulator
MQRITITLDDDLMDKLDRMIVEQRGPERRCNILPITSSPNVACDTAAW